MKNQAHLDRKGMDSFLAVMDLIENPEKYRAGIDELIKRHDDVMAAVELIAPAKEIEKVRSQCVSDQHEAKVLVESAKAKAKKIMEEAEVKASKNRQDAEDQLKDVEAKRKKLKGEVSSTNIALDARERSVGAREKMAEAKLAEGNQLVRQGRELKDEFETKLKKMKAL